MKTEDTPQPIGRPPLYSSGRMKKYKVALDPRTIERLKSLTSRENISEGIRIAALLSTRDRCGIVSAVVEKE